MTQEEILNGNKLIAAFMPDMQLITPANTKCPPYYRQLNNKGLPKKDYKGTDDLQYQSNWERLMPVVEQIERRTAKVTIEKDLCIIDAVINGREYYNQSFDGTKIRATYSAVIQFIEWYNKRNK